MFNMQLYTEGMFFSVWKTVVKDLTLREMKRSSETLKTIKLKDSSFSDFFNLGYFLDGRHPSCCDQHQGFVANIHKNSWTINNCSRSNRVTLKPRCKKRRWRQPFAGERSKTWPRPLGALSTHRRGSYKEGAWGKRIKGQFKMQFK